MGRVRFDDRGAALIRTVQRLPALVDLSIYYYDWRGGELAIIRDNAGLPRCEELAELHSQSLTKLHVSMLGGPGDGSPLRLSGLPELRTCQLCGGYGQPDTLLALHVDAASFEGAPLLQSLSVLYDEGLKLDHDSLRHLTSLTSLVLKECGLESIPPDVASLGATLVVLDLSSNCLLQIDDTAVATILHCSRLETLAVCKERFKYWQEGDYTRDAWDQVEEHLGKQGYEPSQFDMDSWKALMQLPITYSVRHGRHLEICVDNDEW